MNDSDNISEKLVVEIFTLAARLHEENARGYTQSQLQQIAAEVGISPECVDRAVREVQARQTLKDDRQKTLKPQVPWLKGIYVTTSGLLLFFWLAPILWDISYTFYLALSQDTKSNASLERSERENSALKATVALNNLKREEMQQLKAQVESLQMQVDAAEHSYHIYLISLSQQTSRWSQAQKVENNRLVANLNGLLAERDRLIAELRQQATASAQAVTPEMGTFIN